MENQTRPQKVYCGNGKRLRADNEQSPVAFYIYLDELLDHVQSGRAQVFKSKRGRGLKLLMYTNSEPDKFDNTHAIVLDDYVPAPRPEATYQEPQMSNRPAGNGAGSDLPF
jgi:hypothetical protein